MKDDRPLTAIFAACGRGTDGDVEHDLARMLAEARAAWPDVAVSDADYVRHVAARAPSAYDSASPMPPSRARSQHGAARLSDLHAADLYLACACTAGDEQAIRAFDRRYLADLRAVLPRCGVVPAAVDEVIQSLRKRLLVPDGDRAKIAEYSGRGPLGGWLHVVATRAAANLLRDEATRAAVAEQAGPPASLPSVDPELATIQRRYGGAFNRALHDAFAALSAEERSVLRFYFVDGLNIARIGDALGLSRATVGRRMVSARERLLAETLRLLGERLRATPTELESLLAVVRSKLDVSLAALVGPLLDDPH